MKKTKILEQGAQQAIAGFNELQNEFLVKALDDYSAQIRKAVSTKAGDITQQKLSTQQGNAAEAHHVGSYNIEAAAKGANNHRATRDVGRHNDPVTDIRVRSPKGTKDYQSKFYETGEKSAKAFNHRRYRDVEKLVPQGQVEGARATARKEAARNADTRPEVSQNYEATADSLTDSIHADDRPDIRSKPLKRKGKGSSEELVRKTKKSGDGPEYADKDRVRQSFNRMQYANAAQAGALSGAAITVASEFVGVLRSDEPLTREQCMQIAENVVVGAMKGAGNALLVTGIQHAGQHLLDTASHTVIKAAGRQMVKGNIAACAASMVAQLGQNLYQFSQGEIDSIEFAGSTISHGVSVAGGAVAYSAGTTVAAWLGQFVASEIASTAVLGVTLGALGPIAVGTVFSLAFSFALSAYTGHFSGQGNKIAMADIQGAMAQLNGGEICLAEYAGRVGSMSEFTFAWRDLLPFSGSISVFGEYRARKRQLIALQHDIAARLANLPDEEREAMYRLHARYQRQIRVLEQQYEGMLNDLNQQARTRFGQLNAALTDHLEQQYLMFTPVRKQYAEQRAAMSSAERHHQMQLARMAAYRDELERLRQSLAQDDMDGAPGQALRTAMMATIQTRLSELLPEQTAWDQAHEFLTVA